MRSMAELATEISSMAAKNVADNERDVQKTVAAPKPIDFNNAKPSQLLGGTISNMAAQSRSAFLDALDKFEATTAIPPKVNTPPAIILETPAPAPLTMAPPPNIFGIPTATVVENLGGGGGDGRDVLGVKEFKRQGAHDSAKEIRYAEPIAPASPSIPASPEVSVPAQPAPLPSPPAASAGSRNIFDTSPFMQIARRFLQVGTGEKGPGGGGQNQPLPQIGIRDFMSGADSNFGLPKGRGCLPFISEFMQIAYGKCQNTADEKTFDAWGEELRRAILTGEIDLLKASQETCRRGAERQQCDSLREAVANCDVMASLEIGTQLQRNMKRCEDVSGMIDQNPAAVLGQLNSLISGEVAQGFLNNFLKNG